MNKMYFIIFGLHIYFDIYKALWQLRLNNQNSRKLENITFLLKITKNKIKYLLVINKINYM